jgi:hypothetical protein
LNFVQFLTKFDMKQSNLNELIERIRNNVCVEIFQQYPSNPKNIHYPNHCKYQSEMSNALDSWMQSLRFFEWMWMRMGMGSKEISWNQSDYNTIFWKLIQSYTEFLLYLNYIFIDLI